MTGVFYGHVDEHGKPHLHDKDGFNLHLSTQYRRKRFQLTVGAPKRSGSTNQQRYYFGRLVSRIMEEIGEYGEAGRERVHDALMRRYFPTETKGCMEMRESYRNLDRKQREQYHEWIRVDASMGEITGGPLWLPQPNEEDDA